MPGGGRGGRGGGRGGRGGRGGHADPADSKWEAAPSAGKALETDEQRASAAKMMMTDAPVLPGTVTSQPVQKRPKGSKPEPKPATAAAAKDEAPAAKGKGKGRGAKAASDSAPAAAAAAGSESEGMSRAATTESASSGRGRRGRATEAASGGLEISNRTRQAKKDRPAAKSGDAAAAGDSAAAAAGDEPEFDESNITVKAPEGADNHRYKMARVSHGRVKIQTSAIKIGDHMFMLKERSVPGQDDVVYDKNRDIWEAVPRGHCIVSVETAKNEYTPIGEMLGMRKFGYRDAKYGRRADIKTVVGIEKENGECAHLSAFKHAGVRYWLAGSKHVTIFFRDTHATEDIKAFRAKPRTKMASKVAELTLTTLNGLSREKRNDFHDALADNDWTANAEVIFSDSQHIVDYDELNEMRFYAITGPGPSETFGVTALGPDQSRAVFERCGVHAVKRLPRVMYNSPEYREMVNKIARTENSEGCVMYGEDANGQVVCMWKEKAYPYVMERIVREAIKGQKIGTELADYIQYRLGKQEKAVRQYFVSWERERLPFLLEFAAWLREINAFKGKDVWDVSCQWLSLQRKCKDVDPVKRKALALKHQGEKSAPSSDVVPILLAGPPGSGKSTLSRALYGLLKECGLNVRWFNQDEAGGDRKKFIAGIERALRDTSTTHVILDKSNLAAANRKDYTDLKLTPAVTLVLNHPEGPEALAQLCIDRVVNRGQSHRSLRVNDENAERTAKIIKDFVERADWPEDPTCAELDVQKPLKELLRDAWGAVVANNPKPLKSFEELDADRWLNAAMDYERLLARFGGSMQLFASIKLLNGDELRAMIPSGALSKKIVVKSGELHITVKYFGGEMDPITFVEHARRVGTQIQITLNDLVCDEKGACITASGKFTSANANAHITVGNAPGIAPVYSNELLLKPATQVKRVALNRTAMAVFAFQ